MSTYQCCGESVRGWGGEVCGTFMCMILQADQALYPNENVPFSFGFISIGADRLYVLPSLQCPLPPTHPPTFLLQFPNLPPIPLTPPIQSHSIPPPSRAKLEKIVRDKHEDTMSKMGAIMAAGLLDAGGRNVTIGLRSKSAHDRMTATVGMAVFTQFWYWYPLVYFISLTFVPTALIGLQEDLKIPKFDFVSDCRPSLFAYPPPTPAQAASTVEKAPVAVLSTAGKLKSRVKKDGDDKAGKMEGVVEEKEKEVKGKEEREKEEKGKEVKGKREGSADVAMAAEGEGETGGDAMEVRITET